MYYVYIIKSSKDSRHYIGYTNNLERRLSEHNKGKSKSVMRRGPFTIVYYETIKTEIDAIHREKQIKSYKGGKAFKRLLSKNPTPSSSLV
ncbi:MAG: GIY-YIG nuclease family protein [Candidatus Omnitrophica bacterium]|nr:GIY-YIG nuclease family protein [Candidatus Omnitrophota bacterium]